MALSQPSFYQRKLYALLGVLLHAPTPDRFSCLNNCLPQLANWWEKYREDIIDIARTSDRLTFDSSEADSTPTQLTTAQAAETIEVRHLISGQSQQVTADRFTVEIPAAILNHSDPQNVLLWLWRFHPELQVEQQRDALLYPSERSMPDCPHHSYASTVSALTGAMFPEGWQDSLSDSSTHNPQPYLLLFTFSPVQEFIKASRKFLDFWAGSYLLHYLSADLCWYVAKEYGADAVITPSLWAQEIIDAMILKDHPDWKPFFACFQNGKDPIARFNDRTSTSLSTAGFPNVITLLAGSKEQALAIGQALKTQLNDRWQDIAKAVREHIKERVISHVEANQDKLLKKLQNSDFADLSADLFADLKDELSQYTRSRHGCWEWNTLWNAQIEHSWEPYYVAVPLGHPESDRPLQISKSAEESQFSEAWINDQNTIVQAQKNTEEEYQFPSAAEKSVYRSLNVGTWWGSYQARLGQLIQSVKNTRSWQIPVAPGERSSLSGQYSAVHPRFKYDKFQNGCGMSSASMRLFWWLMAEAYPGLFNGSEKLNAIELTKRMAWMHGGVAETLGIDMAAIRNKIEVRQHRQSVNISPSIQILYERLVRFPNLSSIAAARFMLDDQAGQTERYWDCLSQLIKRLLPDYHRQFKRLTRLRPAQIHQVDRKFNPQNRPRQNYNGVMFSSKWLGDDLNLSGAELATLRQCVAQAHQKLGFGESSPSDWWVLVLGDGDGMGKYVSGGKLKPYQEYLLADVVDRSQGSPEVQNLPDDIWHDLMENTRKRMGPATHVGLNRALLDFSNRLVPYLTEQRFCGRVIYSGGDDVMVALPLADLPGFLRSLRAAWAGEADPEQEFQPRGGYWHPPANPPEGIPNRPLFTMGKDATMSLGIVIAHKSVPLPTVLEKLWEAEKDRAKKLLGYSNAEAKKTEASDSEANPEASPEANPEANSETAKTMFPEKDGLCFRVIYGSGNTLEALMKGHLLESWWQWISSYEQQEGLSALLYRLAEVLPNHADATPHTPPLHRVAKVVIESRDQQLPDSVKGRLLNWINEWEAWAWAAQQTQQNRFKQDKKLSDNDAAEAAKKTLGTRPEDLSNLLRFTAFWISRRQEELSWKPALSRTAGGQA